ncbi:hypothetical protein, partial [Vreelandella alkaliphila]|uniref:hypothetical protein n=1 Tax=Vreelandella alkaliphila TaxID=272774 RepID=UPI003FD6D670
KIFYVFSIKNTIHLEYSNKLKLTRLIAIFMPLRGMERSGNGFWWATPTRIAKQGGVRFV